MPSFFTRFPVYPSNSTDPSSAAARMAAPRSIAVDPVTKHVFVGEWDLLGGTPNNNRIAEYTAWGEFVKAFGFGVRNGAEELQICTVATGCLEGLRGSKPGEFEEPNGLAFDAAGDLYVFERRNFRVQKFDPTAGPGEDETEFLRSWGEEGKGSGQFYFASQGGIEGSYITIDPSSSVTPGGTVYVADRGECEGKEGRVQAFDSEGNLQFCFPLPEGPLTNQNPGALAFDPGSGNLYFAFNQRPVAADPTVYTLKPVSGEVVRKMTIDADGSASTEDAPVAMAVDGEGSLYVIDDPLSLPPPRVLRYSGSGELMGSFDEELGGEDTRFENGLAIGKVGEEPGQEDLYVSHSRKDLALINVWGPVPDPAYVGPPPAVPPAVEEQYALSVGPEEARLQAQINPRFWGDATYHLEYGTSPCSAGGCSAYPASEQALTTAITASPVKTKAILLGGLETGTTYHYRFVAVSSGGGPAYGEDPDGEGAGEASFEDGLERTFTTPGLEPPQPPCPGNAAFRNGPAARLPDCRAYEMVSPVDKNGADISVLFNVAGYPAGFSQSAAAGGELSFAAYRAFGDATSAPYSVQYLARRGSTGWSSSSISPPREGTGALKPALIDGYYEALSTDLASSWLFHDTEPRLDPAAPTGYPNLYRRDNATSGYEALVTTTPVGVEASKFRPLAQGTGGSCTVFQANGKLTSNALANGKFQLYERCQGQPLKLVSVLEGGGAAAEASAGSAVSGAGRGANNRKSRLSGAVAEDGSVVFWSDKAEEAGKLYARVGGSETVALSKGTAQFWGAAGDGSVAIFSEGETLYSFTLGKNAKEAPTPIAQGFKGLLGTSANASVIYLVSSKELAAGGTEGEPNLYRFQAGEPGSFRFIATLGEEDANSAGNGAIGPVKTQPIYHSAQVSGSGEAAIFTARGSLSGFDNRDTESGEADAEVYLYRAGPDQLLCLSCAPSGVRPAGRKVEANAAGEAKPQPTAANIPTPSRTLAAPRLLSTNGNRAFFDSYVPLAPGDTNGTEDVYQWEASGEGNCSAAAPGYDSSWAGCVNLISSGESPQDSELVDASEDGRDVFFKTASSLVPQDPGLLDVYDAREGGGFPPPPAPEAECEGEACQSPAPAPEDSTPPSQGTYPGNQRHCPKGSRLVRKGAKKVCKRNSNKRHHKHRKHRKRPRGKR